MSSHPYQQLTPDAVLDALASVGLHGDGRLLALSSYENRVYQVHLEDEYEGLAAVVAKFYRPGRWSEAQILEEHAFAAELMAGEVPAVGPLVRSSAPSQAYPAGGAPPTATPQPPPPGRSPSAPLVTALRSWFRSLA